jgi:HSP20 family protein
MFSLIHRRPARTERALARAGTTPFLALRDEMENLFERFMGDWRLPVEWTEAREWEVSETDKEVVMRLEIPGFEAKEIDLRTEGNVFTVRAEHPEVKEEKEKNEYRHTERYEYRFTLPVGTDANGIEATYRNGVLEVHLPRLPEAQPKRVEVKT